MSNSRMTNDGRDPAVGKREAEQLPACVARAMLVFAELPITGYLCRALFDDGTNCLVGAVYQESRGRFRDGKTIQTSFLLRRYESAGYSIFETFNGSWYVVCEWAQDCNHQQFTGVWH